MTRETMVPIMLEKEIEINFRLLFHIQNAVKYIKIRRTIFNNIFHVLNDELFNQRDLKAPSRLYLCYTQFICIIYIHI